MTPDRTDIAIRIEHTALKPSVSAADIVRICDEAVRYRCAAVCVPPNRVTQAHELLHGSGLEIATVAGFPHGDSTAKATEARQAAWDGASDIDMVLAIGRLLEGDYNFVRDDIKAVVEAAKGAHARAVKVILEVGYLSRDQILRACELAETAGADYVKTSTGFGPAEPLAKPDYIRLMREAVGDRLRIKASGGIATFGDAMAVIAAGADRIGTSRTPEILG